MTINQFTSPSGADSDEKTLTTGFIQNIPHSGEDGATAYMYTTTMSDYTTKSSVEEITKSTKSVDFCITDRAADCSALFENLGVEDEKTL